MIISNNKIEKRSTKIRANTNFFPIIVFLISLFHSLYILFFGFVIILLCNHRLDDGFLLCLLRRDQIANLDLTHHGWTIERAHDAEPDSNRKIDKQVVQTIQYITYVRSTPA
jgi:hypothetical protein